MTQSNIASTAVHEGGTHGIYPSFLYRDTKLGEIFKKDIINEKDFLLKTGQYKNFQELSSKVDVKTVAKARADYKYLSSPHEIHARINEIRYEYLYNPGEKITTKEAAMILEDIKFGKTEIDPNWAKLFKTPDALKKMMNTAPAVGAVAATTLQE